MGGEPGDNKGAAGAGLGAAGPSLGGGALSPTGEGGGGRGRPAEVPFAPGKGSYGCGGRSGPGFSSGRGVGVACAPPPPPPILQASGAHRVRGARSSPLRGDRPHPLTPSSKGSFGDRLCDLAFPTGGTGGRHGAYDTHPPTTPPGVRPAAVGRVGDKAAVGWGRRRREGRGREEGGGCPAVLSAGRRGVFPRRGQRRASTAHVPWKILWPAPLRDAPGRAAGCDGRCSPEAK